ncbi:MAG: Crp/Fnr family transcriptional regulator [Anaerolineae bacterium]|nr:Crp/Fnr family transcriptional regulator [Anaerolineae bacterium]
MTEADLSYLNSRLRAFPCFDVLDASSFHELTATATRRAFSPDEVLFTQGAPSAGLWLLEDGSVKIVRYSPEGGEHILRLFGPGDSFNDIPAFDGGTNAANAVALTLTTCWVLPTSVLRGMMERHPGMAIRVAEHFGQMVRSLTAQIEELALYPVNARIARFLLNQAENPSLSSPGVTRAAIAAHLATTPETISRVLAKFQEAGVIRFDRHRIVILDRGALNAIALL